MSNEFEFDLEGILRDAAQQTGGNMFSPQKESQTTIRIPPPLKGNPVVVNVKTHWMGDIMEGQVLNTHPQSPSMCPVFKVCKAFERIAAQAPTPQVKEEFAPYPGRGWASKLRLNDRYWWNVIPEGAGRVMYMWTRRGFYTDLFDPDTGEIAVLQRQAKAKGRTFNPFHPEHGHDIILSYYPSKGKDAWGAKIVGEQSPITVPGWERQLHNLQEVATSRVLALSDDELIERLSERFDEVLRTLNIQGMRSVGEICGGGSAVSAPAGSAAG